MNADRFANRPDIHAIILTLNEELHIARCIKSIAGQCTSVTVVDSGSSDRTADIARELGSQVVVNPFVNHSAQLNFAIDALASRGGWLFRIDADEVLNSETGCALADHIARAPPGVNGLVVARRIHFLGRRIRWGGIEPNWQLRLWRNGRGRCEDRWMDEHVRVDGLIARSGVVISDINLNPISWWTAKHNGYASREALEVLNLRYGFMERELSVHGSGRQARWRRFLKNRLYQKVPRGFRAAAYFLFRYFALLGCLDGYPGWCFHTLQGFWYRSLVDAKVYEVERYSSMHGASIPAAIEACLGLSVNRRL
ncbi:MAG: glycosyltransferase family 2 protein [Mesorhizobium sp.]|uniref:glycosyltransferase family 2 protein n=1 Tax=Mesorhizobium sp. TaxID=1871066 RepID=UPI000FE97943|nr:glycosyltransferase family 2 protein [Mesorhizobium sp.]RWN60793.1 MAG: glycosyltransferase family 2 protein [Mesorhizobium sp.]RWO31122.1 MAG: glycosyltransferase family 2 protein [Mesorhizobium sp.]TIL81723.1 MAG: glycosyltransferase family 2 protein [Mesorhizobium sp.]TIM40994.1 MAG: glycosyltransferase family 2 protein [Mesorhizobium sp.]